jgi:hypothetical protein
MIKNNFYFILIFSFFSHSAIAQQRYAVNGYIRDANTGEDLIGATITIEGMQGNGSITNAYGFYSISLPAGLYQITAQFLGYTPQMQQLELAQTVKIDFSLVEQLKELDEVMITGIRKDENVTNTQMGLQKLDAKEIKSVPVLFGEKDLLKTIQL